MTVLTTDEAFIVGLVYGTSEEAELSRLAADSETIFINVVSSRGQPHSGQSLLVPTPTVTLNSVDIITSGYSYTVFTLTEDSTIIINS